MVPAAPTRPTDGPALREDEVAQLAASLAERDHPDVARALRGRVTSIVTRWRVRSRAALLELDGLTIAQFEDSVAIILNSVAQAMESQDPLSIRRIIAEAPAHGLARFAQKISPHIMLAEARILRSVIILELREELNRPLSADEAAALHELLDVMVEYSILALVNQRSGERDQSIQSVVSGMHRLADLGTLVAGVAHDASNLLLPLWMTIDHLDSCELPAPARESLETVKQIVKQFQNSIVNLRWLSIDSAEGRRVEPTMDLHEWRSEITSFYAAILPRSVSLRCDIPEGMPRVRISSAALSQAVFNLVRNAQHAIVSAGGSGSIRIHARVGSPGDRDGVAEQASIGPESVDVIVEDDGPGMPAEVLRRCREPFFTTAEGGSGLGLALVQALIVSAGGLVEIHSPRPARAGAAGQSRRGTMVVLSLPPVGSATPSQPSTMRLEPVGDEPALIEPRNAR
jgi:signal transduction histidine kinase